MERRLLILGAGQYGAVAKEIAEAMGCFAEIAYLDDGWDGTAGPVVGRLADCETLSGRYSDGIVAMGSAEMRQEWLERLAACGYGIPVLISPRAYVSPSAKIGRGSIVEPLAGVHANAVIGEGVLVSMGAVVNHNAAVMDYCHIDCGAVVSRGAVVPRGTKAASGTVTEK